MIPTPEALAKADEIVAACEHAGAPAFEGDGWGACVPCVAQALTEQAEQWMAYCDWVNARLAAAIIIMHSHGFRASKEEMAEGARLRAALGYDPTARAAAQRDAP